MSNVNNQAPVPPANNAAPAPPALPADQVARVLQTLTIMMLNNQQAHQQAQQRRPSMKHIQGSNFKFEVLQF